MESQIRRDYDAIIAQMIQLAKPGRPWSALMSASGSEPSIQCWREISLLNHLAPFVNGNPDATIAKVYDFCHVCSRLAVCDYILQQRCTGR